MERELFDWEEYDIIDEGTYQFYNVVLKKQVKDFLPGTTFEWAVVNFQKGELTFLNGDSDVEHKFKLHLTVE